MPPSPTTHVSPTRSTTTSRKTRYVSPSSSAGRGSLPGLRSNAVPACVVAFLLPDTTRFLSFSHSTGEWEDSLPAGLDFLDSTPNCQSCRVPGKEQQMVHRNILLIAKARIGFVLILEPDVEHLAPESENPRPIHGQLLLRAQLRSGRELCRRKVSPIPSTPEAIHGALLLLGEEAKIAPNPDPAREKQQDVYPACCQRLEHFEPCLKTLGIDERKTKGPTRKAGNDLLR